MKNNPIYFSALISLLFLGAHAPGGAVRAGKDYALFFAVENYQYWSKLGYPIDDAEAIAKILHDDYGFETEVVRDPSLADIFAALGRYNEKMKNAAPDAQLLLFFTGHGYFEESLKEGFFIPKDGKLSDLTQGSYLSFPRLQNQLRANNCRHILLAIDACYSGSFDIALAMKGTPQWGRVGDDASGDREHYIREELQLRSRLFLASGKLTPTPDQSEFASRFQKALLSKGGDDRILSMSELWAELEKARPRPHRSHFEGNEEESNFLFIARDFGQKTPEDEDDGIWKLALQHDTREAFTFYLQLYPEGRHTVEAKEQMKRFPQPWVTADGEVWGGENIEKKVPDHMVLVEGGTFEMGDLFGEGDADEIVRPMTVSSFLLAKYELTFREYDIFCEATARKKPSDVGWGRDDRPVMNVSWFEAIEYCNWRSIQEGYTPPYNIEDNKVICDWTADGYRLPTEAEWEYAAREKGLKVRFGNGKDVADPAEMNFDGSAPSKMPYSLIGENRQKTVPIGSLKSSNSLGLYDMTGNIWEWCWDWYVQEPTLSSPYGPDFGDRKVFRGGSWNNGPAAVRISNRYHGSSNYKNLGIGFRLARTY